MQMAKIKEHATLILTWGMELLLKLRERPFNLKGGGYVFFLKNILIPNVAEKNILILVEEKKKII
jgi:hypothetical protein